MLAPHRPPKTVTPTLKTAQVMSPRADNSEDRENVSEHVPLNLLRESHTGSWTRTSPPQTVWTACSLEVHGHPNPASGPLPTPEHCCGDTRFESSPQQLVYALGKQTLANGEDKGEVRVGGQPRGWARLIHDPGESRARPGPHPDGAGALRPLM